MFNLSGAINVLLFLGSKPQLLLFAPPVVEHETELTRPKSSRSAINIDTDQNPQPTVVGLVDGSEGQTLNPTSEGHRNSASPSWVNSRSELEDDI
jgi:hypothetical protein